MKMIPLYLTILSISYLFLQSDSAFIDVDVKSQLKSNGFHRTLFTNITLYGNLTTCGVLVEQKLNEHVYVKPTELETLKQRNILLTRLNTYVSPETTVQDSDPFSVWLYNYETLKNSSTDHHSTVIFSLPIHVRLHEAQIGGGSVNFTIAYPNVLLNCSSREQSHIDNAIKTVQVPCSAFSSNVCDWILVSSNQKKTLKVDIPVGNLDHLPFVVIGTHSAVAVGIIYLLYNLLKI